MTAIINESISPNYFFIMYTKKKKANNSITNRWNKWWTERGQHFILIIRNTKEQLFIKPEKKHYARRQTI